MANQQDAFRRLWLSACIVILSLIACGGCAVISAVMRACGDTQSGCNLVAQPFSFTSHGLDIGTLVLDQPGESDGSASSPMIYLGSLPGGGPFISVFRTGEQVHVWFSGDWNLELARRRGEQVNPTAGH